MAHRNPAAERAMVRVAFDGDDPVGAQQADAARKQESHGRLADSTLRRRDCDVQGRIDGRCACCVEMVEVPLLGSAESKIDPTSAEAVEPPRNATRRRGHCGLVIAARNEGRGRGARRRRDGDRRQRLRCRCAGPCARLAHIALEGLPGLPVPPPFAVRADQSHGASL